MPTFYQLINLQIPLNTSIMYAGICSYSEDGATTHLVRSTYLEPIALALEVRSALEQECLELSRSAEVLFK